MTVLYEVDDVEYERTVHLSLLFAETVIGKKTTWTEIVDTLTPAMIEAYTANALDIHNPTKVVNQISVMNHKYLDAHYTTISSPESRDIPTLLWRLQDLSISQRPETPTKERIDFNKCLCSVNGLLSLPTVYNNELLMPSGTTFMMDSGEQKWPDIVLLDFTHMAPFQLIPFSACTHKVLKPTYGSPDAGSDIELKLPEGIDLTNKSVMIVIGHTLIFHDQLYVTSKNTIHITPYVYPLNINLLMMKRLSLQYVPNTDTTRTYEENVLKYLYEGMFSPKHYGAFVIVVDIPNMYIAPMEISPEARGRLIRTKAPLGIVRRLATLGIVDYVHEHYNNIDILYLNDAPHLFQLDIPFLQEQIGVDHFQSIYNNIIRDIHHSPYEMVRLLA
jgi:hypothetical protein